MRLVSTANRSAKYLLTHGVSAPVGVCARAIGDPGRKAHTRGLVCAAGVLVALTVSAVAGGFGGPALEIGIGGALSGYRQTYQTDRVAMTGFEARLALSEGVQASWGGLIRGGAALRYRPRSVKQSSAFTFMLPTDTTSETGKGTHTETLNTGLSGELFLEPGFAINDHIAVLAHAGYECGQLRWSQTWDYAKVVTTAYSKDTAMLCGPDLGGRVVINPDRIAEFSIGAFYRYAEGTREQYIIDHTTYTGPTASEFRIEVNWIIAL